MKTLRSTIALALILALMGCGGGSTDQEAATSPPAVSVEEPQVGVTGIPIDPSQKTVVVVTPPGAARSPQQQMSELQAQNTRTEAQIAARMQTYSGNLGNAEVRNRVASQMDDDLEAYKKQSLEMYKLQQQMPDTPPQEAE